MHGYDTYDIVWRQYYPAIGRFQTPDPEIEEAYNESPYAMCDNNMVNRTDSDGRIWANVAGAVIGAAVEYGSQVAANVYEGKGLKQSLTDIDLGDVAISAGEGFLTSGTSAVKSMVGKAAVTIGAEVLRNTFDVKKDGAKVNNATSVVINTTVGLVGTGVAKALPSTKIKVQAEVTPKQAVKAARDGGAKVTRAQRVSIQTSAKKTLTEAKALNNTANGAAASTTSGAASEIVKRKGDKSYGNGNQERKR